MFLPDLMNMFINLSVTVNNLVSNVIEMRYHGIANNYIYTMFGNN